jgi:transcriptional regulator with PAS, ATPase and Fis domain
MLTDSVTRRRGSTESAEKSGSPAPAANTVLPPRDAAMRLIDECALQVAQSDETVLLLGETGVGKDVMARKIHQASPRAGQRFVAVNCAALPDGLLESELFGHVRGAYTGAVDSQQGLFEVAQGGTIFLDEIGELSPRLQAKLLHVLQEKVFCRVGGREAISANVRVIAATNQDLDKAMVEGTFRRDLFYRLSVVALRIPALRERPGDIEGLARFFARKYAALYNRSALAEIRDDAIVALKSHRFEGNIRELENLIKRAILLGSYQQVLDELARSRGGAAPMPAVTGGHQVAARSPESVTDAEPPLFAAEPLPLKEVARRAVEGAEKRAILEALSSTSWNRRRAARLLRVSYRSLLYKIRDYAIVPGLLHGAGEPDVFEQTSATVLSPREGSC